MPKRRGRPTKLQVPRTAPPGKELRNAEFARWSGCPPPRVTEWRRRDLLKPPAILPSGLIAPRAAVEQLVAAGALVGSGKPSKPAAADPSPSSYDEARAQREALRVQLTELELAERRGELVPKALADQVLFDAARAVRDAWQGWPARVAAVIAARLGVAPAALLGELEAAVRDQLAVVADPKADWRRRSAERLAPQ